MKHEYVWMLITDDKYELPLAVADTASELGKMIGKTSNSIISNYSKFTTGLVKTCKYRKVKI